MKGVPSRQDYDPVYEKPKKVMGPRFTLKIECVDCGGWYAETKDACPFCNTVNMDKFEDRFVVNNRHGKMYHKKPEDEL